RRELYRALDLIDIIGADALRFMFAISAALGGRDLKVSEQRVEGYRNFATKLWNAARFAEMNECVVHAGYYPLRSGHTVNRWILGKVAELAGEGTEALETFRFNEAANALYQFTWGTYCDWYLGRIKPILSVVHEDLTT